LRIELLEKKKFDRAIIGKTPRGQHPGIVQHQEIIRPNELQEVRKSVVSNRCARPVQHHHAGILATRERSPRN
jgi:hypothetical protein